MISRFKLPKFFLIRHFSQTVAGQAGLGRLLQVPDRLVKMIVGGAGAF